MTRSALKKSTMDVSAVKTPVLSAVPKVKRAGSGGRSGGKSPTVPFRSVPGVSYSQVTGARCPICKAQGNVYRTMPWEAGTRVRYHLCRRCGKNFKSVESIADDIQRYRKEAMARALFTRKKESQV